MKFAVAYINNFDNCLKQKLVEAADWRDALVKSGWANADSLTSFEGLTMEQAQEEAFSQDWNFSVIEV